MSISFQPLITTDLSGVFALSEDDFKQIQLRVNSCDVGEVAIQTICRSLPAFRGAVAAAAEWKSTLLPELKKLAKELNAFTEQTISAFVLVEDQIEALPESTAILPIELKQETKKMIDNLGQNLKPLYTRLETLNAGLATFVVANAALDFQIASKKLGFMMQTITENLNRLEAANSRIRGRWFTLYNELRDYATLESDIDMAFIMGLQLKAAISGWRKLEADTARFLTNN
ncbi:hypothetical protein [Pedobacter sp. Hv1]|uniref:hypothetical protein n=1 Tax=Pedobacter sp. Hv1 TaxID=1740090 RepID=UPI0006D8D607|nr:hypothetical protein [Pedobacter sp. Hv1]KQC01624.1 hypothetical protein AQF98_04400 [Pedobacter sp. Hv1]